MRVPGTKFELDPVQGRVQHRRLVRWLDFNDTWLAAEWGHPSDNLGAILACADYARNRSRRSRRIATLADVRDVLTAMIKAHEIQGVLALENAFNRVGLDHVLLVRVASTAVATAMLGGTREQVDQRGLQRLDRRRRAADVPPRAQHRPRKSWAAGDATSRAVRHALMALTGEMGYPTALERAEVGLLRRAVQGPALRDGRPLGSYVMEHVLFKVSFPAEFHAQTAVECAMQLHPHVKDRLHQVERIVIETQEPAVRIIDKTGPLDNPADRDHCLQYMVAVPLIHGTLTAEHYEDEAARDPRIDALRQRMQVVENRRDTRPTTWTRTSGRSPTRCRCSSRTAARRSAWRSNTRSATAGGARRRCRCCGRSSKRRWRRGSTRSVSRGSSNRSTTPPRSTRRPRTSSCRC